MKPSDELITITKKFEGSPLVQCWQMHNNSFSSTDHSVLPSAYFQMVFPLNGQISVSGIQKPINEPFVVPILSRFQKIKIKAGSTIFGVHIQPFYCSSILGHSPSDLVRNANPVKDVFSPNHVSLLKDAVLLAENFDQRANSILRFFENSINIQHFMKINVAKNFIHLLKENPTYSLQQASKEIGYTARWMQKVHKELIGITPGEMGRIIRFNKLVNKLYLSEERSTQLALDCGYYDQAHAIHEFKRLGGITPGNFSRAQPSISRVLNYETNC